jgi:hypothetical protein
MGTNRLQRSASVKSRGFLLSGIRVSASKRLQILTTCYTAEAMQA